MEELKLPAVNQRIKELIAKETRGNKAKFARKLGYKSAQKLNRLFLIDPRTNKFPVPSSTILTDISNTFDVAMDWLIKGDEEKPEQEQEKEPTPKYLEASVIDPKVIYVPLVNQYAYGGYLSGLGDETYLERLPKIPFIVDFEDKGNHLAFEVRGDSMDDGTYESYREGDRVLCKEVPSYLWAQSKLNHKRWDYVIIHNDGIILKKIIDHDVENHTIIIHSLNDFYPDRIIDLAEVQQIFCVKESVRGRRR